MVESAPAGPRRTRALRYGSIMLASAVCLLVVSATIWGGDSPGKHTTTRSALSCSSPSRLGNAPGMTTPLGVNATGAKQLAAATAQFGHMPVIRVYYAGVPTPSEWTTGATGINKSSVVLSFNPTPAQVLSGADDAGLATFFDSAPTGHAIYYSFYPEPEAHVKNGEFTLTQYKQAWARVVAIADAAHNSYLHSTLILQGQDGLPGDEYNFKNYLPDRGVITAIGWDAYPDGTVDDQDPRPIPPVQFMCPDIVAAKSVGLPFGFAEFALGTATGRPMAHRGRQLLARQRRTVRNPFRRRRLSVDGAPRQRIDPGVADRSDSVSYWHTVSDLSSPSVTAAQPSASTAGRALRSHHEHRGDQQMALPGTGPRAPACSVNVRICPNRGREGGGFRLGWCGRGGLRGCAGTRRL